MFNCLRWLLPAVVVVVGTLVPAGSQPTRVPTVTRLVQLFAELESRLMLASHQFDAAALQALLADDFELRVARQPGVPTARAEWLAALARRPAPQAVIEQLAVHDHGALANASFLLRPVASAGRPVPALFVVDTWVKDGDNWRLKVRYAAPQTRESQPVPGESLAPPIDKRY